MLYIVKYYIYYYYLFIKYYEIENLNFFYFNPFTPILFSATHVVDFWTFQFYFMTTKIITKNNNKKQ